MYTPRNSNQGAQSNLRSEICMLWIVRGLRKSYPSLKKLSKTYLVRYRKSRWIHEPFINARYDWFAFFSVKLIRIRNHHFWRIFQSLGWFGHTFCSDSSKIKGTRWRGYDSKVGWFCPIPACTIWRLWGVGGQCGPGVPEGLSGLAFLSVFVRPSGCLFFAFSMRQGLSTGTAAGCSSRRRSHGYVRGTSRLCDCIQQALRLWPESHQESRPQLRLAGATAAVSFRRHRGYSFGAPAAAALLARRHIWLIYLVGLFFPIGLVYLLVCLLVGLLVCLVGLGSVVSSV